MISGLQASDAVWLLGFAAIMVAAIYIGGALLDIMDDEAKDD